MNRIPIPYYVIYWQPLIEFNSRWLTQPSVWSWTSTAALIGWPTWWVSVILRNWSYNSCLQVKEGKKITGPEQLKDAAFGCARIRGDTLGIVGLGKLKGSVSYSSFPPTPYSCIYGLRTFCGEGSGYDSNCFGVQFSNSVVGLKRDLHQQVGVISDLLSWLSVAKFGIGLPFPPPLQSHPTSLCCWAAAETSFDIFWLVK